MTSTGQLLESLGNADPAIRSLRTEHIATYGELLPHVLFGDLTRWMLAHHPQPALLGLLEDGFATGDSATQNLIAVSFVENIEPGPEYAPLREALGPRLRQVWNRFYALG